jgi:hypothetical protein
MTTPADWTVHPHAEPTLWATYFAERNGLGITAAEDVQNAIEETRKAENARCMAVIAKMAAKHQSGDREWAAAVLVAAAEKIREGATP